MVSRDERRPRIFLFDGIPMRYLGLPASGVAETCTSQGATVCVACLSTSRRIREKGCGPLCHIERGLVPTSTYQHDACWLGADHNRWIIKLLYLLSPATNEVGQTFRCLVADLCKLYQVTGLIFAME